MNLTDWLCDSKSRLKNAIEYFPPRLNEAYKNELSKLIGEIRQEHPGIPVEDIHAAQFTLLQAGAAVVEDDTLNQKVAEEHSQAAQKNAAQVAVLEQEMKSLQADIVTQQHSRLNAASVVVGELAGQGIALTGEPTTDNIKSAIENSVTLESIACEHGINAVELQVEKKTDPLLMLSQVTISALIGMSLQIITGVISSAADLRYQKNWGFGLVGLLLGLGMVTVLSKALVTLGRLIMDHLLTKEDSYLSSEPPKPMGRAWIGILLGVTVLGGVIIAADVVLQASGLHMTNVAAIAEALRFLPSSEVNKATIPLPAPAPYATFILLGSIVTLPFILAKVLTGFAETRMEYLLTWLQGQRHMAINEVIAANQVAFSAAARYQAEAVIITEEETRLETLERLVTAITTPANELMSQQQAASLSTVYGTSNELKTAMLRLVYRTQPQPFGQRASGHRANLIQRIMDFFKNKSLNRVTNGNI